MRGRVGTRKGRAGVLVCALAVSTSPLAVARGGAATGAGLPTAGGARPDACGGSLASHPPIAVNSKADLNPANGVTGGNGTTGDPFVISCWSIEVGPEGDGIRIFAAANVVVHDVLLTGSGRSGRGLVISRADGATVESVTASGFGTGFDVVAAGTRLRNNLAKDNRTGFAASAFGLALEGNVAEHNADVGIDLGTPAACAACVIQGNWVRGNGSVGILAFAAFPTAPRLQARIEGNHVGYNPFGIALVHGANSSVVQDTHWIDGHQSILRGEDLNSIVDAGSNHFGIAGEEPGVFFHDYVATVTVTGAGAPVTATNFDIYAAAPAAVPTRIAWDFGDGTPVLVMAPDALQGHALSPEVRHPYAEPGSYIATITVEAIDSLGRAFTLSDTTLVAIQPEAAA